MACDMPEPCKFPSLDGCQKGSCGPTRKLSFLCTQSFALCSKKGDAEKFPHALGFESLDPFFFSFLFFSFFKRQQVGSMFQGRRAYGMDIVIASRK